VFTNIWFSQNHIYDKTETFLVLTSVLVFLGLSNSSFHLSTKSYNGSVLSLGSGGLWDCNRVVTTVMAGVGRVSLYGVKRASLDPVTY
jgi:hypothetical protein